MAPTTTFHFRHDHSLWRRTELYVTLFDGPDDAYPTGLTGAPFLVHLVEHRDDYDEEYYHHHEYTAWCQARGAFLDILYVHYSYVDTDARRHWTTVNDAEDQTVVNYLRRFFNMPAQFAFDADLERLTTAVYAASAIEHYDQDVDAYHTIFPGRYRSAGPDAGPDTYDAIEGTADAVTHTLTGTFARLIDRAAFFEQERAYYDADILHAGDLVSTADGLRTTLYASSDYDPPAPDSWQGFIYEYFCQGVWRATGFRQTETWTYAATTIQRAFRLRYRRRRIAAASWTLTPHLPRVLRREILIATGIMAAFPGT